MTVTFTDLFCGAGGSSLGAEAAGMELKLAMNHWRTAIDVHQLHFPDAGHDCFPADVLVLTESGHTPINEVKIGTLVLTHRGRWRPVVRVFKKRGSTIRTVGTLAPAGVESTSDHKFWIRRSRLAVQGSDYERHFDEPSWVEIGDASVDTVRRSGHERDFWSAPCTSESLDAPSLPDGFDWWIVGRWLGDGSANLASGAVEICCGHHEREDLATKLTGWKERETNTAILFYRYHKPTLDWLVEHFGKGSAGKDIPGWALTLPRADRVALLEGYISADGNRRDGSVRVSSVSKALALGCRDLALSLGYAASLHHSTRKTHATIEGRSVKRRRDVWTAKWKEQPQRTHSFEDGRLRWAPIRSAAPARSDIEVFTLEVEDDHSYVADGIVVKNCADISQADPRRYVRTDVLLASPECTHHSQARGVSRQQQDPALWDAPDPEAERSRATMWDVVRFAEQMRYEAIVVENVVDAANWINWRSWLMAMEELGYERRILSHNSMHHGVPQSRDRIYVVFTRKGLKVDLEMELPGWCGPCDKPVNSRQTWKNGRTIGRYGKQYFWSCPTCGGEVKPPTRGAGEIIDWSIEATRIGDRSKPLVEKTIRRIAAGLARYGWLDPVVTAGAGHTHERTPGNRAKTLDVPLSALQTTATHALAAPGSFLVQTAHGGDRRPYGLDEPHPTVTASDDRHSLVVPMRKNGNAYPTWSPLATVTAGGNHHGLLMRNNHGGAEMVTPLDEPARTMTTKGHQSFLAPGQVKAGPSIGDLAELSYSEVTDLVSDCGFRMLEPAEVIAAMAFPAGYIPDHYTKKDKVKLAGNAVTPPVQQWISGRIVQALEAA